MTVALVTDSTAELGPDRAAEIGATVVPLQVVIDDVSYDEGSNEATPEKIAVALRAKRSVSTSRPAPAYFARLYAELAGAGAEEILAVHLSSEVSGTFESAQVAARAASVEVVGVDTRQIGPATGYAVETAAAVLADGGTTREAAYAAIARAAACTTLMYVDTLEYLRRGGRVGGPAALLGGALAVKPLLQVTNGVVTPVARIRTAAKAIARLEAMAVEAAGEQRVEITLAHLDAAERAGEVAGRLGDALSDQVVGEIRCTEIGAVLGAHAGPGLIGITVAPVVA